MLLHWVRTLTELSLPVSVTVLADLRRLPEFDAQVLIECQSELLAAGVVPQGDVEAAALLPQLRGRTWKAKLAELPGLLSAPARS